MKTTNDLSLAKLFLLLLLCFAISISHAQKITLSTTLYALNQDSTTTLLDMNKVIYKDGYCDCVDGNDVTKLLNPKENLILKRYGHSLSLEARPLVSTHDTLHYYLTNTSSKKYRLQLVAENMQGYGLVGYIMDFAFGGKTTYIKLDGSTTIFDFEVDTNNVKLSNPSRLEMRLDAPMFTVKAGNWSDPSIWDGYRIPTQYDGAFIKHAVTVDVNAKVYTMVVEDDLLTVNPDVNVTIVGK